MMIDTRNRAAWIKLFYYLTTFVYLLLIVISLYLNLSDIYFKIGLLSLVFFSIIIFSLGLHFNYIIFQESDQKILLRYYSLHPFHDAFKSIEIPKSSFSHFEIKHKLFGLRPELTLYQQTSKGLAKYPSVSISSLSSSDQKKLLTKLLQISKPGN